MTPAARNSLACALLLVTSTHAIAEKGLTLTFGQGIETSSDSTYGVTSFDITLIRETRNQRLSFAAGADWAEGDIRDPDAMLTYTRSLSQTLDLTAFATTTRLDDGSRTDTMGLLAEFARPNGSFGFELARENRDGNETRRLTADRRFDLQHGTLRLALGFAVDVAEPSPVGSLSWTHQGKAIAFGTAFVYESDRNTADLWLRYDLSARSELAASAMFERFAGEENHEISISWRYDLSPGWVASGSLSQNSDTDGPTLFVGISRRLEY